MDQIKLIKGIIAVFLQGQLPARRDQKEILIQEVGVLVDSENLNSELGRSDIPRYSER